MLRLPAFQYKKPRSMREAARILAQEGPDAMVVAGGTDLWPKMKRRQMEPKTVIGLRHLSELRRFDGNSAKGWVLGAGLTLHELENHPVLASNYPAVAEAARSISSPPLKTMGTLGGNLCVDTRCNYYDQTYEWRKSISFCLKKEGDTCWVAPGSPRCWAASSTDLAPVMLALNARFLLVSGEGDRMISASELYQDDGIRYLTKADDEILKEVHLPAVNGDVMAFLKLRRRDSIDFPILNVAVWGRCACDRKTFEDLRIAIGAITSRPFVAEDASRLLVGKAMTPETIEQACEAAWKISRPLDNTDLDFSWRHKMVRVWVRRALELLVQRSALS
ncbi:MAG: FAD binding domain-containing protein [Acidobacteria bacterium]|nr:FAD binding domain-containing protein [Acidobacteriota bacterium]